MEVDAVEVAAAWVGAVAAVWVAAAGVVAAAVSGLPVPASEGARSARFVLFPPPLQFIRYQPASENLPI